MEFYICFNFVIIAKVKCSSAEYEVKVQSERQGSCVSWNQSLNKVFHRWSNTGNCGNFSSTSTCWMIYMLGCFNACAFRDVLESGWNATQLVFVEFINTDRFCRHVINARVNIQVIFDSNAHAWRLHNVDSESLTFRRVRRSSRLRTNATPAISQ